MKKRLFLLVLTFFPLSLMASNFYTESEVSDFSSDEDWAHQCSDCHREPLEGDTLCRYHRFFLQMRMEKIACKIIYQDNHLLLPDWFVERYRNKPDLLWKSFGPRLRIYHWIKEALRGARKEEGYPIRELEDSLFQRLSIQKAQRPFRSS